MRVGVEVGGTFTDLIAVDGERIVVGKVASVPARPDEGAMNALVESRLDFGAIGDLVHGSTVATNAILERKGARTAFLATAGFRDILLLQRHNRRQIYDLFYAKPEPVIARSDSFEVRERIDATGAIVTPLDVAAVRDVLAPAIAAGGYQSVAVCLINAYANPAHERRLGELLAAALPDLRITLSSDVTREFREYERASTTALAAYVQPVIEGYLDRFGAALGQRRFAGRFSIMQSNGGRIPAEAMARNAITSLFSGPAAGVIGAVAQATRAGYRNLITLDMGGTSTDVCLIDDGRPALAGETEVDGLPIRTPVLDIATVGAGGGSIIWRDDGGMLRVGPQSAGADPGPACYGRGGTLPTVTDAHMLRGTLRPADFLGGQMQVDADAADGALSKLAAELGLSAVDLADAALRVADSNIVRAIQLVSTERGRDPRDHVLLPFGGAGPLHAARVAEDLDIDTILVPPNAGVLSAYGLLAADYARYATRTRRIAVDADAPDTVRAVFGELAEELAASLSAHGVAGPYRFDHALDMRYVGQAFEVTVELPAEAVETLDEDVLRAAFSKAYGRIFQHGETGLEAMEIVSFRLGGAAPAGALPRLGDEAEAVPPTEGTVTIHDRGATQDCRHLRRGDLAASDPDGLPGPVLIADTTSTVFVPAGWRVARDAQDNLILRRIRG